MVPAPPVYAAEAPVVAPSAHLQSVQLIDGSVDIPVAFQCMRRSWTVMKKKTLVQNRHRSVTTAEAKHDVTNAVEVPLAPVH